MIPPSKRSRNVPSFVPPNSTISRTRWTRIAWFGWTKRQELWKNRFVPLCCPSERRFLFTLLLEHIQIVRSAVHVHSCRSKFSTKNSKFSINENRTLDTKFMSILSVCVFEPNTLLKRTLSRQLGCVWNFCFICIFRGILSCSARS